MSHNEPIQNRRVNLRGIISKDGKLFCQMLKQPDLLPADKFWCTPGGGIDFGESLHEGLTRELIEETGVAPEIGKLLFIQQFKDGEREQLEFFFHIVNADDYEQIDLAQTSHGELEVDTYGFVDPKTTTIRPMFLTEVDIEAAIATQQPVFVTYEHR